jgi:hypothetical protein
MTKSLSTRQISKQDPVDGGSWDFEVRQIADELVYLKHRVLRDRSRSYYKLVNLKVGVVRLHLQLERALERLKSFTSRELLLLPRDSALIKWSRIFVDKTLVFFRLNHDLKSKTLWVNLLSAKLGRQGPRPLGGEENGNDITDDLLELPLRYKALCQTESLLLQSIEQRKQTILRLTGEYHAQQVAQSNREALHTLNGRLGTNFENSRKSPYIKSLGRLLILALAPIKNPEKYSLLEQLLADQDDLQQHILGICRHIAGAKDQKESPEASDDLDSLVNDLGVLVTRAQAVEAEVTAAYHALLAFDCLPYHPIIVQNLEKKATNSDRNLPSGI